MDLDYYVSEEGTDGNGFSKTQKKQERCSFTRATTVLDYYPDTRLAAQLCAQWNHSTPVVITSHIVQLVSINVQYFLKRPSV